MSSKLEYILHICILYTYNIYYILHMLIYILITHIANYKFWVYIEELYLKPPLIQANISASKHAETSGMQVQGLVQGRQHQQLIGILCQNKNFKEAWGYN